MTGIPTLGRTRRSPTSPTTGATSPGQTVVPLPAAAERWLGDRDSSAPAPADGSGRQLGGLVAAGVVVVASVVGVNALSSQASALDSRGGFGGPGGAGAGPGGGFGVQQPPTQTPQQGAQLGASTSALTTPTTTGVPSV